MVMASVFWNPHGILFINYLEKGKTINNEYYTALLDRLSAELKKKVRQKSIKIMVKLDELRFELFSHHRTL